MSSFRGSLHSIIAENRTPNNTEPSLIWENALNIADVLTLLSLARARYYPTLLVERNKAGNFTLAWGLITQEEAGKQDIVPFGNFGSFITKALSIIKHNPDWLKGSGFDPSIHWYHQAQLARGTAAPSILEMALYWISIEIVASVYIEQQQLNIKYMKPKVKRFFEDNGYSNGNWSFLDSLIDDWYQIRCDAFHEGICTIPNEIRVPRRKQVRDLTSLVLIEMLQPLGKTRKEEIAQQILNYMTIQNDSSNSTNT